MTQSSSKEKEKCTSREEKEFRASQQHYPSILFSSRIEEVGGEEGSNHQSFQSKPKPIELNKAFAEVIISLSPVTCTKGYLPPRIPQKNKEYLTGVLTKSDRVSTSMSDHQETKCNITTFLALRYQSTGDVNAKADARGKCVENAKKQGTEITLPDDIIRHVILCYRPFRSFRVVLIRGENNRMYQNNVGGFSNPRKREYSLTFGTNRGNLRFQVVEFPYLPPHNKSVDAETYRGADGVVISCYMTRFFEFCERYGYHYASSSILEDVKGRREPDMHSQDDEMQIDAEEVQSNNDEWQCSRRKTFPRCIVLCGNNVDITHVDARLSSIVFWEEPSQFSPNSHIEAPRHPFSSLARSLTNDDGLEFHNVRAPDNSGKNSYHLPSSKMVQHDKKRNHDDELRNWNWLRAQVS